MFEDEEWKDIPGYGGKYQASNLGRIKGFRGIMKQRISNRGYYRVYISKNSNFTGPTPVHQLILLTFVGERPRGMVSRHLDGNSFNNNINNLKYGSVQDNVRDAMKHGTFHNGIGFRQSKVPDSKIIELLAAGKNQREIAEEVHRSRSHICHRIKAIQL